MVERIEAEYPDHRVRESIAVRPRLHIQAAWALASLVALSGCGKSSDDRHVARVGESVLLESMIDSSLEVSIRDNETLRETYIQEWVSMEILYRKALLDNIDKDPRYLRQMERLRKELLIQAYLEKELAPLLTVSESEIQQYYDANQSLFLCHQDEVRTEYFLTRDRARARKIAAQIGRLSRMRKKDFLELVSEASADSDIIGTSEFQGQGHFDPRAARFLFAKNAVDEVVGPILTGEGYYGIWHVVALRPKGAPRSVEEVRAEIESRLKAIRRKKKIEELISKAKAEVEVDYGIPRR